MALISIPNAFAIAQRAVDDLKDSGDVVLTELIGAPSGVAGLDADSNIIGTVEHRVETASAMSAITVLNKELAITSDTNDIVRGDGTTAGGLPVYTAPRRYTGSGEMTAVFGVGAASLVLNVPVVAGGVYEISGVFGFSGDTDSLSNLFVQSSIVGTVLDTAMDTYTGTILCEFDWIYTTGATTPERKIFTPTALPHTGTINFTPVSLNKPSGKCRFSMRFPVNVVASGNYRFNFYLRTAKVGSPTVMAGYDIVARRLK